MRLPWLQIDADGMTRGEMLGRLLGIGPDAGIGMTLRLWRWALEMSPDGDFSGGQHAPRSIAAAIGWAPEEASKLVGELVLVGLVEMPVSAGFARIKGLSRYSRAWEKNKRRKPALVPPVTGRNPADSAPVPARKTETESKEDLPPRTKPAKPPAASLVLSDAMVADFLAVRGSKYLFSSDKDGPALAALRKDYSDPDILRRWGFGLRAQADDWLRVSSIAQLRAKWNDLPSAGPADSKPIQTTLTPYPENFR